MSNKSILSFIDPNDPDYRGIQQLLLELSAEGGNYEIYAESSRERLLKTLQSGSFTAVLLGLPVNKTIGDGLNLLLQMRQMRPDIPVIVLVNEDIVGLGLQAVEFGAVTYVAGHYLTPQGLNKVIEQVSDRQPIPLLDEAVFNSYPACVVILDEVGRVTAVNQEWHQFAQETTDPLITQTTPGINMLDLCHQLQKTEIYVAIQKILQGQQTKHIEEIPWRENGDMSWWRFCVTALRWPQGGAILSVQEVTDAVVNQIRSSAIEDEISQMRHTIMTLVHELRTPLSTMHLYLDLIPLAESPKRDHYLTVLKQETSQMEQYVDDLLTLAQLEQDDDTTSHRPVNIVDLAEHVVLVQQPVAAAKGLSLTITAVSHQLLVSGRARQLTRVLTNLVANAIRYTDSGSIHVSIQPEPNSNFIEIAIMDTGIGIAPEVLPHIFEPFFRSPRAQQTSIRGTGLGLSIVQRIVLMHNGRISVTSEINKGTNFQLFLPLLKADN